MLIVFTGNGKGKTTAAIGQALRAVGNGASVLMVQFIKGPWKSGEDISSKLFGDNFRIVKKGKGFVGILGDKLPRQDHVDAAHEALDFALSEAKSGKCKILIMDEIWVALSLDLITTDEVSDFISAVVPLCEHVIMTGRGCPQYFIDRADIVTEMKEIKHPFTDGIIASKNLEF